MCIFIKPCISVANFVFFLLYPKIEILKHIPEGAETEQGLQRELQLLRYIICYYDNFFLFSFFF